MKAGTQNNGEKEAVARGACLRELRERTGKSQVEVAAVVNAWKSNRKNGTGERGGFDAAHLSRIENGKLKYPRRETLEDILTVLEVTYRERREILELYGYTVSNPLPTPAEIAWACAACAPELHDMPYPAYFVDCGQRLHTWNRYAPRLIGMQADDPRLALFQQCTVMDLAFNPAYRTSFRIDHPEENLPDPLYLMKVEFQPFLNEPWYAELINRWRHELHEFVTSAATLASTVTYKTTFCVVKPMYRDRSDMKILKFRLLGVDFVQDPRFHLVRCIPIDVTTMRQCIAWVEEETVAVMPQ